MSEIEKVDATTEIRHTAIPIMGNILSRLMLVTTEDERDKQPGVSGVKVQAKARSPGRDDGSQV